MVEQLPTGFKIRKQLTLQPHIMYAVFVVGRMCVCLCVYAHVCMWICRCMCACTHEHTCACVITMGVIEFHSSILEDAVVLGLLQMVL